MTSTPIRALSCIALLVALLPLPATLAQSSIEQLLAERTKQDSELTLRDFFAEIDEVGVIPVSLVRWQLTGKGDEIEGLLKAE